MRSTKTLAVLASSWIYERFNRKVRARPRLDHDTHEWYISFMSEEYCLYEIEQALKRAGFKGVIVKRAV